MGKHIPPRHIDDIPVNWEWIAAEMGLTGLASWEQHNPAWGAGDLVGPTSADELEQEAA